MLLAIANRSTGRVWCASDKLYIVINLGIFENIWEHLGSFGIIWEKLKIHWNLQSEGHNYVIPIIVLLNVIIHLS